MFMRGKQNRNKKLCIAMKPGQNKYIGLDCWEKHYFLCETSNIDFVGNYKIQDFEMTRSKRDVPFHGDIDSVMARSKRENPSNIDIGSKMERFEKNIPFYGDEQDPRFQTHVRTKIISLLKGNRRTRAWGVRLPAAWDVIPVEEPDECPKENNFPFAAFDCGDGKCSAWVFRCLGLPTGGCDDQRNNKGCDKYVCKDDEPSGHYTKQGGGSGMCVNTKIRCTGPPTSRRYKWNLDCDDYMCRPPMMPCPNGKPQCMQYDHRCDGKTTAHARYRPPCGKDGSDELYCDSEVCPAPWMKCPSGINRCIIAPWICDGLRSCPDGSDEDNCENHQCADGYTKCGGGSGLCVAKVYRCNGRAGEGCGYDGSDETDCGSELCPAPWSQCPSGVNRCMMASWVCDGRVNCPDRSDEHSCEKPHGSPCNYTQECGKGLACRSGECDCLDLATHYYDKHTQLCKPKNQCPDGFSLRHTKCYQFVSEAKPHGEAAASCSAMGGDLAEPLVEGENDVIHSVMVDHDAVLAWLGAADQQYFRVFVWHHGGNMTSSHWAPGQPSPWEEIQHCLAYQVDGASSGWDDRTCYEKLPSICQSKAVVRRTSLEPGVNIARHVTGIGNAERSRHASLVELLIGTILTWTLGQVASGHGQ